MKVYVITSECADPAYDDEFEGHVFSTKDKASDYINNNEGGYRKYIVEIELDKEYK